MKKNKLIAGLCILASGLMFASCEGDNTDAPQNTTSQVGDSIPSNAYKVKVLYPDGTPATGVKVQWCSVESGTCYNMVDVDTNGQGYTTEEAITTGTGNFNVHVNNLPTGYGYNPYAVVQNSTSHDDTITLIKLNSNETLSGSKESPDKVTVGYYSIKVLKTKDKTDKDEADKNAYIYFETTEAGSYTIESYSPKPSDLEIYFAGNDLSNIEPTNDFSKTGGNENNFKYTFTVSEDKINTPFVFILLDKGATSTFTFSISKN